MNVRRVVLFLAGLVVGYVLSGFVLGPSVLAVIVGIIVGAAAVAVFGR